MRPAVEGGEAIAEHWVVELTCDEETWYPAAFASEADEADRKAWRLWRKLPRAIRVARFTRAEP